MHLQYQNIALSTRMQSFSISVRLWNGLEVLIRPILPVDIDRMKESVFHGSLPISPLQWRSKPRIPIPPIQCGHQRRKRRHATLLYEHRLRQSFRLCCAHKRRFYLERSRYSPYHPRQRRLFCRGMGSDRFRRLSWYGNRLLPSLLPLLRTLSPPLSSRWPPTSISGVSARWFTTKTTPFCTG